MPFGMEIIVINIGARRDTGMFLNVLVGFSEHRPIPEA